MVTKQNIADLFNDYQSLKDKTKMMCIDALIQLGATSEDKAIVFDWDESGDAPSHVSTLFDDDICDCYISKIWLEDNQHIYVDLHAYYLQDDREHVFLADDGDADYMDILLHLEDLL